MAGSLRPLRNASTACTTKTPVSKAKASTDSYSWLEETGCRTWSCGWLHATPLRKIECRLDHLHSGRMSMRPGQGNRCRKIANHFQRRGASRVTRQNPSYYRMKLRPSIKSVEVGEADKRGLGCLPHFFGGSSRSDPQGTTATIRGADSSLHFWKVTFSG